MKKYIIVGILLLFTLTNFADNYRVGLGLRVGTSLRSPLYGANFKCFLTDRSTSALEFMLNYEVGDLILNSFYEFHKESRKSSRQVDYLNYYAGVGFLVNKVNQINRMAPYEGPNNKGIYIGPACIFGFEVGFSNSPFVIGLDLKPMYNLMPKVNNFRIGDASVDYAKDYIEIGASLRYTF